MIYQHNSKLNAQKNPKCKSAQTIDFSPVPAIDLVFFYVRIFKGVKQQLPSSKKLCFNSA